MSRPKIYLSGPISKGDKPHNFHQAAKAQLHLMREGFAVLNPMLSMLLPGAWDVPHEVWMESDIPWVQCADAVLRLPGESVGADLECAAAAEAGVEVFYSITKLLSVFGARK